MGMKRIAFVVIVLLLSGCAATNKAIYTSPQYVKDRADLVFADVVNCMNATGNVQTYNLFLMEEMNAMVDIYNNVLIAEGFFYNYDDKTISFILAHEISHAKLNHPRKGTALSVVTTGIFVTAGFFVPGIGLLNHAVNPLATKAYGRSAELDADKMASEAATRCFDLSIEEQVHIFETLQSDSGATGGGFWADHPSWEDRIDNIRKSP